MKNIFEQILKKTKSFLTDETVKIQPKVASVTPINTIEKTLKEAHLAKQAVHVIYNNKSFTGDIVKLDSPRGQVILKNFKQNLSTIIRISDIQRIRLVPEGIRQSQRLGKKTS